MLLVVDETEWLALGFNFLSGGGPRDLWLTFQRGKTGLQNYYFVIIILRYILLYSSKINGLIRKLLKTMCFKSITKTN